MILNVLKKSLLSDFSLKCCLSILGPVSGISRSQPIAFSIPVSSCAYVTATNPASNYSSSSSLVAFSGASSNTTLSCVPSLSSNVILSSSVTERQQEANTAAAVAAAACFGECITTRTAPFPVKHNFSLNSEFDLAIAVFS